MRWVRVVSSVVLLASGLEVKAQGGFGGAACPIRSGMDRSTPSSTCLTCHTSSQGAFTRHQGGHPVDASYADALRAGRLLRPNPTARVANVVLPGGQLTCMTCHDGASTLPFLLAAPMDGPVEQRLCNACHAVGED